MPTNADLYTQDFFAWTQVTAALIRQGKFQVIDLEALADEVAALGHADQCELEQCLREVLGQLLRWWAQPEKRCGQWKSTIRQARCRLTGLLDDSPSLQAQLPALVIARYPDIRDHVLDETRLYTLPSLCPFTLAHILDKDFWPESSAVVPENTVHES